jgi:signal transduction histidine kinase/CheY-like chemotaxis protein
MPSSILAKYSPELILGELSPIAIADDKKKIIWYNNIFKKKSGISKLNGLSLESLFRSAGFIENIVLPSNKPEIFSFPKIRKDIRITPLFKGVKKKIPDGYKLELITKQDEPGKDLISNIIPKARTDFRNELQEILTLMVKENSIDTLSAEILMKSAQLSNSDFGLIVFLNDSSGIEFKYHDPDRLLPNRSEIEKIIRIDFNFITKWLVHNQHSLVALNESGNIGYNLTAMIGCKTLIISPCFFDGKLIASLITGKFQDTFSPDEITLIEQFATLLNFVISNINTRDLNAALESRLLQAQKLETIGKLSSGIAHDFGNLLSSIFGSVNLLRKRVDQNESVQKLIDNIENCSVRARDLTKGLLSFGKPTPKRKELVKPHKLLDEIIKIITQTFPRSISFTQEIDEQLFDIVGNSTEIYQVLLNLCVNAKEAVDGKGRITITVKNTTVDKENQIYFPLLNIGNYVKFSVQDDGIGIEEKNLSKIFDPYFSTKSKDTGSGLGLYVSYGIIKAHSGYFDVSSKPGKGTTFDVYIPAFEPKKEPVTRSAEKIILLADDEPMLGDLLSELLETNGFTVIKVSSGNEVLKVLTEEIKVDLAIIDYNMPGMSGLDTIFEIRKLNLNIPIILSSGSMWVEDESELLKYNINSQIQKPYEFETMLATIQKLI